MFLGQMKVESVNCLLNCINAVSLLVAYLTAQLLLHCHNRLRNIKRVHPQLPKWLIHQQIITHIIWDFSNYSSHPICDVIPEMP